MSCTAHKPTITILLPTFSRAHYLPLALESVLAQTFKDFELLILDDASTDDTETVAREYAAKDGRIRYIRHRKNLGITRNWRHGLEAARGEFLCFLEDDDLFLPTFLEEMLVPLRRDPALILAFCDHWIIDDEGREQAIQTEQASRRFGRDTLDEGVPPDMVKTAILDASIGITAALFRREFIAPSFIDDRALGGIDVWFLYQCARTKRDGWYLPRRLMRYRVHESGMSHSMPALMGVGHLFLYEEALRDPANIHLRPALRRRFAEIAASRGIHLLHTREPAQARHVFGRSLKTYITMRALMACLLTLLGMRGSTAVAVLRQGKSLLRVLWSRSSSSRPSDEECIG